MSQRNIRVQKRTSQDSKGKRWAVLVGIDNYQDARISPLRYCVADIKEFYELLISPEVCGFDKENIYLMTDADTGDNRPTHTNVLFRLEKMAELIEPLDTFVFYFAGHGIVRSGKSFLLSVNADKRSLRTLYRTAVPLDDINEVCGEIKAHQKLIILDACRNDPESGRGDRDNLLTKEFARNIRIAPSTSSNLPSVTATLFSCSVGERAYEWHDKEHGIFSYYLLQGLRGEAADANGEITAGSLADYTQRRVVSWVRRNRTGAQTQTPWLEQQGGAKLVVARIPIVEIPSTTTLKIGSEPQGAKIFIDGQSYGKTPKTVDIDTGVQGEKQVLVGLELDGYRTKRGRVTLRAGRTVNWSPTLEKIEPQRSDRVVKPKVKETKDLPKEITGNDGVPMVLIPAGEFEMGSNDGADREKPVHTVYTDAFYMDKYQVTNELYAKFLNEYGKEGDDDGNELIEISSKHCRIEKSRNEYRPKSGFENHPVVEVSWYGAKAYAEFYGKRLPTEAEWEKAARGGLVGKRYPWGDESPDSSKANYDRNEGGTTPVGKYPPNGYGLYDIAGNVREWCNDWYDSDYYSNSPRSNPRGPSTGSNRLLRGGSWLNYSNFIRVASRNYYVPPDTIYSNGFRCCVSQDITP